MKWGVALVALLSLFSSAGRAESPQQWIELGTRIHGGFGAFIPAGIRIGLDALERLKAERRGVTVVFYSGERSPCPCIADGVMLATQASPGQGTLQVAAEKAPAGLLAVVVIRDRKTGGGPALQRRRCLDGQDRRVEQGPRSRRALSGGDVGARPVRGRGDAVKV
ncbi:MAG TPA: formylmethanofuran dehydrogenase subunit E family protein [Xanthobacteraceae bacterium]